MDMVCRALVIIQITSYNVKYQTIHIGLGHRFQSKQCLFCHPTCCFMSVTACGCMISCVWEWWSIASDSMNIFVSVWLLAGYTEKFVLCKASYTLSVKPSDFTTWQNTWWKNWVNCTVLTSSSAGLRTVLSSFFHIEECAVHSGNTTVSSVYLPTPRWHHLEALKLSSKSFSSWASHDTFLSKYHFLLHILDFIFFFLENIIADVANRQQTKALLVSTTVTRTRRQTELTKTDKTDGKPVLYQWTFSSVYHAV
jgi:hypothetical protein